MFKRLALIAALVTLFIAASPLYSFSQSTPYLGAPVSLPGHIKAENFDEGGEGVAYHDTTPGNTGGRYRQTGVDIEACAAGGQNIGWIDAGEWLNYWVQASAGTYTLQMRVASPSGGSFHVGFNGPSNVWKVVTVPATGGWQSWTTVSVSVTLGGGAQQLTVLADTSGMNLDYFDVLAGGGSTSPAPTTQPPQPAPSSTGGTHVTVVTWNTKVDSSGAHAIGAIDRVMSMTPEPQIVVLQEVKRSLYATYIAELEARSGRTWEGHFQNHCPVGAWNGSYCASSQDEGVAVFSSLPVVDRGSAFLPGADEWHSARGVARLAVNVNGVTVQVFSVHLPVVASGRATAMSALKSYSSQFSAPRLAGGDFNADRDQIDPAMSPNFVNSWGQVGSGNGFTAFTPSPTMKLDYWFQDNGGRATPDWSVVVTAAGTFSDHYPLINSYTIR